jgi:signal transduction histidine kinase
MKKLFSLFFFILSIISYGRNDVPLAVHGVLDLRNLEDPQHFIVKLNGEWEFYWKQMLHPYDFDSNKVVPEYYGKVPSYWTDYSRDLHTENFGYATYRLRILLPKGFRYPLAFDLPVFDSSYDVYVNGSYFDGNGITGKSAEESKPEYRKVFFRVQPDSDLITIIINVSNYHHRRGGFWLPAKIGTFSDLQKGMANSWAADWSVISVLLGCSILFFFFFIFSPGGKIMGFFSIVSTGLALRPLFTNHFLIENFVNIQWLWLVRLEYFNLYFIITGAAWFASKLYPSVFARLLTWSISVVFILAFILTLLLPVKIFSYFILVFYPSLLIVICYLLFKSFRGALKNSIVDTIYLMAFILLLAGGLNDNIVSMGKSNSGSGYLLSYMIVAFVIIQASLLLYKWIKSFQETEKLKVQMEFMNRNLEELINQRTHELQVRNIEIEEQNKMIALQNKQLSDTIQIKNRIFSVISHDLRSPVVNILYMLNLLKEKEYKEKYDTFANSSINYAQGVISLLENMLVWGRGQEDKIKYSPEKYDLADIILTNLSIFKETADKKEISVNFTQVGSSIAYCDKDLLDIIIRNLLSNAVKYTPRKGRISIFLRDKKNTGNGILLKVCDNGTGITEERQKQIFESEEVVSTPGTENEKGTGLGLRLCNELIKINNGTISVESRLNEGTCFLIHLPG